jgi:hypothetical protein
VTGARVCPCCQLLSRCAKLGCSTVLLHFARYVVRFCTAKQLALTLSQPSQGVGNSATLGVLHSG